MKLFCNPKISVSSSVALAWSETVIVRIIFHTGRIVLSQTTNALKRSNHQITFLTSRPEPYMSMLRAGFRLQGIHLPQGHPRLHDTGTVPYRVCNQTNMYCVSGQLGTYHVIVTPFMWWRRVWVIFSDIGTPEGILAQGFRSLNRRSCPETSYIFHRLI